MGKSRVLRVALYVVVFPWGIYLLARRIGIRSKTWAIVTSAVASLIVLGVLGSITGGSDTGTDSAGETPTKTVTVTTAATAPAETKKSAPEAPAPEPKANIYVVASKSFCTYTGIDDIYTGEGHVKFFITLRNSGKKDGSIDITPVRRYNDGRENSSPMDQVSVDVPAGQTRKGHTVAMKYKAHEHEITDCALLIDGNEIPVRAVDLGA